jgi:hypothetical protein
VTALLHTHVITRLLYVRSLSRTPHMYTVGIESNGTWVRVYGINNYSTYTYTHHRLPRPRGACLFHGRYIATLGTSPVSPCSSGF